MTATLSAAGPEGFQVHGTWSHGEVPLVSAASAPLSAILFLHKSNRNRLLLLENRKEIVGRLLSCLIKPMVSADWWEKMLALIGLLAKEVPCYVMEFDESGGIVAELEDLVRRSRALPKASAG